MLKQCELDEDKYYRIAKLQYITILNFFRVSRYAKRNFDNLPLRETRLP